MNIQVVSARGGKHELITIVEPVKIVRTGTMTRLICGHVEHWFNSDGTYDGWGVDLRNTEMTPAEISAFIQTIEESRVFP